MQNIIGFVLIALLWSVSLVAADQEGKTEVEAEAHKQTITVQPSENGCAVSLSSKVGKALGTPEGLANPTLGESGRKSVPSLITCQCGTKMESKECAQGGTCACGPKGNTPSVVCK